METGAPIGVVGQPSRTRQSVWWIRCGTWPGEREKEKPSVIQQLKQEPDRR